MILKKSVTTIIFYVAWIHGVLGYSYSNVYVNSGTKAGPYQYISYGAPAVAYGPTIAQLSAPPVQSILPYPQPASFLASSTPVQSAVPYPQLASFLVPPCLSPCVPQQTDPQLANAPLIAYTSSREPVAVAGNVPSNYQYAYVIYDDSTGDQKAARELSDRGVVRGQYSFLQPDGYVRAVEYTADDVTGFNAVVRYLPVDGDSTVEVKEQGLLPCAETKPEALKKGPSSESATKDIESAKGPKDVTSEKKPAENSSTKAPEPLELDNITEEEFFLTPGELDKETEVKPITNQSKDLQIATTTKGPTKGPKDTPKPTKAEESTSKIPRNLPKSIKAPQPLNLDNVTEEVFFLTPGELDKETKEKSATDKPKEVPKETTTKTPIQLSKSTKAPQRLELDDVTKEEFFLTPGELDKETEVKPITNQSKDLQIATTTKGPKDMPKPTKAPQPTATTNKLKGSQIATTTKRPKDIPKSTKAPQPLELDNVTEEEFFLTPGELDKETKVKPITNQSKDLQIATTTKGPKDTPKPTKTPQPSDRDDVTEEDFFLIGAYLDEEAEKHPTTKKPVETAKKESKYSPKIVLSGQAVTAKVREEKPQIEVPATVESVQAPPPVSYIITHTPPLQAPLPVPTIIANTPPAGYVSYDQLLKCIQKMQIANLQAVNSPLTYIIFPPNSKPC